MGTCHEDFKGGNYFEGNFTVDTSLIYQFIAVRKGKLNLDLSELVIILAKRSRPPPLL